MEEASEGGEGPGREDQEAAGQGGLDFFTEEGRGDPAKLIDLAMSDTIEFQRQVKSLEDLMGRPSRVGARSGSLPPMR